MANVATGFALGGIAIAIRELYGVVGDLNTFIDKHLAEMTSSKNTTIARTGRVIEGAKFGFGIGLTVPITIIAVGQMLLGNPLSVASTAITTMTFTNPIAMTCASVGAIYYGWDALSDQERQDLLDKLSHGLEVGIELIKAVIGFVIGKTKELLNRGNLLQLKKKIASAAELFGHTLADVTGSITDKIKGTLDVVANSSNRAVEKTKGLASDAYLVASGMAANVVDAVKEKIDRSPEK